nr:MAG TPA: hypothetical protein [Bacteriophage sp.]
MKKLNNRYIKPYRRGVCENYRCPFIIQKPLLSYFE